MRSKLIILMLILSASAMAQQPTVAPQLFGGRYYQFGGYVRIDSAALFPARDTTVKLIHPGMVYRAADSSFYFWNMQKWAKISTGNIGGSDPLKLNISDTAAMLSPYLRSAAAGATYVPQTRTITINGTTYDLSANRSWTIATGVGSVAWGAITGLLSDQADLQSALNSKASTTHTHAISDVTGLSTSLGLKVNYTDTSSMLSPYLRSAAAGATYQPIGSYATTSALALKLNISDTASMLSGYQRSGLIGLPSGGTTGQALYKSAGGYDWSTPTFPPTTVADVTGLQDSLNGVRNASYLATFAIPYTVSITSGTSSTVPAATYRVDIDPASVLSTYTLTLPASPSDGLRVLIRCGRQISAGSDVVTAFTISPNSGQTLFAAITPTKLVSGDVMEFEYESSTTTWTRIR